MANFIYPGSADMLVGLKINKSIALDQRQVVDTKAFMISTAAWDGTYGVKSYKGMIVAVVGDTDDNNGIYLYVGSPEHEAEESNWIKTSSISYEFSGTTSSDECNVNFKITQDTDGSEVVQADVDTFDCGEYWVE